MAKTQKRSSRILHIDPPPQFTDDPEWRQVVEAESALERQKELLELEMRFCETQLSNLRAFRCCVEELHGYRVRQWFRARDFKIPNSRFVRSRKVLQAEVVKFRDGIMALQKMHVANMEIAHTLQTAQEIRSHPFKGMLHWR